MEIWVAWIIFFSFLVLGVVFFIYFFTNKKYKTVEAIEHYTEIRDEITLAKEDIKKTKKYYGEGGSLIGGSIFLTVVAIVFSQVLMPTLTTTNTTAWDSSVASLWNASEIISVAGFILVFLMVLVLMVLGMSLRYES